MNLSKQAATWIAIAVVAGVVIFSSSQADTKPKRPILNALKAAIKWAPWVAPLIMLDEQPTQAEMQVYTAMPPDHVVYGEAPEREIVEGQAVVSHGAGW